MDRPKKLDEWFYIAMKEMRRNSYVELLEDNDITYEEAEDIEIYINDMLGTEI